MKNFLILLLTVLTFQIAGVSAFAATAQVTNVLNVGGIELNSDITIPASNPDGEFTIYGPGLGGNNVTQNHFYVAYKDGAAYRVTTGKQFVAHKICAASSGASFGYQLISTLTSFANDASSITSGNYMSGAAQLKLLAASPTAQVPQCYAQFWTAPSLAYVGFEADSGANTLNVWITGREQ